MACAECGAESSPDAAFCSTCGHELTTSGRQDDSDTGTLDNVSLKEAVALVRQIWGGGGCETKPVKHDGSVYVIANCSQDEIQELILVDVAGDVSEDGIAGVESLRTERGFDKAYIFSTASDSLPQTDSEAVEIVGKSSAAMLIEEAGLGDSIETNSPESSPAANPGPSPDTAKPQEGATDGGLDSAETDEEDSSPSLVEAFIEGLSGDNTALLNNRFGGCPNCGATSSLEMEQQFPKGVVSCDSCSAVIEKGFTGGWVLTEGRNELRGRELKQSQWRKVSSRQQSGGMSEVQNYLDSITTSGESQNQDDGQSEVQKSQSESDEMPTLTVGFLVSYVVGPLTGYVGQAQFRNGFLSGAFLWIAGVLVLPLTRKYIERWLGFRFSRWLLVVIYVILCLIAGFLYIGTLAAT